ncbi:MAG TPA: hypothetical protein VFT74_04470, partial [Isosphaeraceae bacterium]|nr:hypothetical protein [Isosphaeraceae bacterium]
DPAGVLAGALLTATATVDRATSEFGPNVTVDESGPLSYTATTGGAHNLAFSSDGTNLDLFDNGILVASRPSALTTSVSITGSASGTNTFQVALNVPYSGSVTVSDPTGLGTLTVAGANAGQPLSLSSTRVEQAGISVQYSGLSALDIQLGGASEVSILGTSAGVSTTLDLGSTASQVVVGNPFSMSGSTLDGILGGLSLIDCGLSSLRVDASGASANLSGTLSGTLLTGLGMGANLAFGPLASLAVSLGTGNDVLSLTGLSAPTAVLDAGAGSDALSVDVAGDLSQAVSTEGFESISIQVGGDLSGTLSAPASSHVAPLVVGGSWTSTGTVMAGSFSSVLVKNDLSGTIHAIEDLDVAGSGVINGLEVDGQFTKTGLISGGALSNLHFLNNAEGTITAQGAGTIDGVSIGGSLTGTVTAYVDDTDGSGSISG